MAVENKELSVVDFLKSKMSERAAEFLASQIRCSKRKAKGRRWTHKEKVIALSIYKQSPKCYRFLRSTNNVKPLKTMGSTTENPCIQFEGQDIITLFDHPHPPEILKSTRNLLQSYEIKLQMDTGSLQFEGTASWKDIQDAFRNDKEQMH
ncbi:hypothetical protein J437_LFUL006649 [Ladona fulva]|uniref:Uncharacterized protein n=1 Tax=Ladona fulva TaxID=123851 RepID=A0A8K0P0V0_LADFU|nr:hypothetical protein J437_LFUL006649 [Ladona fulva]